MNHKEASLLSFYVFAIVNIWRAGELFDSENLHLRKDRYEKKALVALVGSIRGDVFAVGLCRTTEG